jgi:uncharacterized membrane protein
VIWSPLGSLNAHDKQTLRIAMKAGAVHFCSFASVLRGIPLIRDLYVNSAVASETIMKDNLKLEQLIVYVQQSNNSADVSRLKDPKSQETAAGLVISERLHR